MMTTIFTFHATVNVVPIKSLKSSSVEYYQSKYPEATHLVMSPHGICYAVCGSREDAEQALEALKAVTVKEGA